MSRLRVNISVSLDGFVAGPDQSVANPLGVGGMKLHQWAFSLDVWRSLHGMEGGESNESSQVLSEAMAGIGATIMGRNMFGGHPGDWNKPQRWDGWWGEDPPFHHPVFVLTHHPREPLVLKGGTTFTFVTDGIESALAQARAAANGKHVALSGGAQAVQQFLKAGRVDEMYLNQVPVLLGQGERLFEGVHDLHGLQWVRTVATPNVTHLVFARNQPVA